MEKVSKRSELIEQIVALRQQQRESTERATYIGWTSETLADHGRRSQLLTDLLSQLDRVRD
jgi:hypothetical protein